ncbi:ABC transporter permease [Herbiconiux moechotypicola]|uniref:Membrane protein n=1 Tax=Herbiconiux moechotypicola TaxID=637393 RepID=A0ABN3D990_9MICO|nr:ABC transporter permease [Herbiconiux moechotypicola]MCS5729102.1 ABC transporter permease [Herbiconiux moechotypicola]
MNRPHTRWSRVLLIGLGASLIVGVFVLAFSWPSITSTVHSIPLAVSGDSTTADTVAEQIEQNAGEQFDVVRVDTRAEAVDLIETRDAYGAVVLDESVPEVLTASANGVVVSQVLSQLAATLQSSFTQQLAAQGVAADAVPTITVTDVVPLADTDARGTGLTTMSFPLVIGGMIGGVVVSLLVAGVWRRLTAVVLYGVAGGVVVTLIGQAWFGILQGSPVLNALAVAASILAISAFIVGLTAVLGPRGIAIGAVLSLLIGNPISSAAQPWQFLPEPWGAIGQFFPPGAGATLLRDLSYFPSASTLQPWLVLASWIALGVVLMAVGHARNRAILPAQDALEEPAGATAPEASEAVATPA